MSAQYATEQIRNVAIVGHSDTGKTTLVSAQLFDSGTVNRFGKINDGNTITDFDDDEIERKITINTAVAHYEHADTKVNLIDTPCCGQATGGSVVSLLFMEQQLWNNNAVDMDEAL